MHCYEKNLTYFRNSKSNIMQILNKLSLLFLLISGFSYSQNDTVYLEPNPVPASLDLISVPSTFTASDKFNGYMDASSGASIIMTLIENISYPVLSKSVNADFEPQNNLHKMAEGSINANSGLKGVWYKYSFEVDAKMPQDSTKNMEFIRYMVFIGNLQKTLWLNITYPKMIDELMDPEMLNVFKSAHFNTEQ